MKLNSLLNVMFVDEGTQIAIVTVFDRPACSFYCSTSDKDKAKNCVVRVFRRVLLEGKSIKEAVDEDEFARNYSAEGSFDKEGHWRLETK